MLSKKAYKDIKLMANAIGIALTIADDYLKNNHYNYDHKGKPISFRDGYMVALKGGFILKGDKIRDKKTIYQAVKYLLEVNIALGNNYVIGFWLDADKLYIDLSINVSTNEFAFNLASMQDQLAYYDIKLNKSTYLADYRGKTDTLSQIYNKMDNFKNSLE